ncbi:NAD(P)-dependent oxidoreductase [Roseomonas sp. NAR14]|uniref:NAD(P)-dependent oxidoreductase n=1 Tax=Roseomonas acroporae TaxID=2937791 RepID=A0A9X1YCK4_9PROT|nr:NAD(P)-dependent oxidoreductase [Roseomonas acroporae]MCK8787668.1 NAD(P)-dependent oxidoreductase [Roseomonas acroporae]
MPDQVIGFIGLGQMGGRMAARLIEAGYRLVVCDRSEAAVAALVACGASRAATPMEVADRADLVLASLPTPDVVHRVGLGEDGVLRGQRARTFVDLSTTGPRVAVQLADAFAEQGRVAIDCPVSGGPAGAEKGTLAIMLSGPRESCEALEPLLRHLGKPFYCGGKPGSAQVMKLCNNLLSVAALAVSAEALVMGVKAGLDPRLMCEVISAGSGRNSAVQDKIPRAVLPRTFDFGFPAGLSLKDVRLCLDEAEALGVPMVVGSAVRQMMGVTRAAFGAEADMTTIVKVVEQWAGVEVKG